MYPRNERGVVRPLLLPFGSIPRSLDGVRVKVADGPDGVSVSFRESHRSAGIQVLPTYRKTRAALAADRKVEMEFWVLREDRERARAYQVILRSHYLNVPQRGFFLGCRLVHAKDEQYIREKAGDARPDPWSPAWHEPTGRMIGVAVADWLYHGVPTGRRHLAERFGEKAVLDHWDDMSRSELVRDLRVTWGARFAVEAPYRSIGIGTLLAEELATAVAHHRLPQARYIEVITTLPSERAEHLVTTGSGDFLTRAGYFRVEDSRPSARQLRMNPTTGDRETLVTARKLYYYRKCG
ncbi:MAG: hypothetical protein AMXMBFR53_07010 [Gemmatimonadota bacterium]